MKLVFCLCFFVFIQIQAKTFQQNQIKCRDVTYGTAGQPCDAGANSKRRCKIFLTCQEGFCKPGHIGSSCTSHTHCYLNSGTAEGIKCLHGTCTKKRYPGYSCQYNDQCYSSKCDAGICTGLSIGETCDPVQSIQCDKGLYCSYRNKICSKQKILGEECDDIEPKGRPDVRDGDNSFVICPGGTQCYAKKEGEKPKCENVYFKKITETCEHNQDCYLPLVCMNGQCTSNSDYDVPCNNQKNCSSSLNERCICLNNEEGTCKQTGNPVCDRRLLFQSWTDCWKKNQCTWERSLFNSMLTEAFQPETCMGKYCGSIATRYLCCQMGGFEDLLYSRSYTAPLNCVPPTLFPTILILLLMALTSFCGVSITIGAIYIYQRLKTNNFERLPE